jgi:hypothetical protein
MKKKRKGKKGLSTTTNRRNDKKEKDADGCKNRKKAKQVTLSSKSFLFFVFAGWLSRVRVRALRLLLLSSRLLLLYTLS